MFRHQKIQNLDDFLKIFQTGERVRISIFIGLTDIQKRLNSLSGNIMKLPGDGEW